MVGLIERSALRDVLLHPVIVTIHAVAPDVTLLWNELSTLQERSEKEVRKTNRVNRFREKEDQKEGVQHQELDQQRRRKVLTMRSNGMALLSLDSLASIAPRGSRRRRQK